MKGGVISRLHMSHFDKEDKEDKEDNEEYLSNLKLLEYDILYGNCQAYEGVNPYKITNMKMGYKPIKVLNGEMRIHILLYEDVTLPNSVRWRLTVPFIRLFTTDRTNCLWMVTR